MNKMALSYTREYKRIIEELAEGILKIHNFYDFFDMSDGDWNELSAEERFECARTLADDVFYALGKNPSINISNAEVKYQKSEGIIEIKTDCEILSKIQL